MDQNEDSDQREGDEGHPYPNPIDVLRKQGANLGADGGARMHHQGDHNINIPLERMGDGAVHSTPLWLPAAVATITTLCRPPPTSRLGT